MDIGSGDLFAQVGNEASCATPRNSGSGLTCHKSWPPWTVFSSHVNV